MVLEVPPAKNVISQWATIISVVIAAVGLFSTATNFIEHAVFKLESYERRILDLEKIDSALEIRIREDHDLVITMQAELRAHITSLRQQIDENRR